MMKNSDTLKEPNSVHTGSIVVTQREDDGHWTCGTFIENHHTMRRTACQCRHT